MKIYNSQYPIDSLYSNWKAFFYVFAEIGLAPTTSTSFNFCFHKIGRLSHETLYKVTSWISSGTVTSKPN